MVQGTGMLLLATFKDQYSTRNQSTQKHSTPTYFVMNVPYFRTQSMHRSETNYNKANNKILF
jgi:hypothetical protein